MLVLGIASSHAVVLQEVRSFSRSHGPDLDRSEDEMQVAAAVDALDAKQHKEYGGNNTKRQFGKSKPPSWLDHAAHVEVD